MDVNMVIFNKFGKLALMASLLVGSASCVQAMDDGDPDFQAAIQASLQDISRGNDDADLQAAIQASLASSPTTPRNIGMDTSDLTTEELWAIIQAQEDSNPQLRQDRVPPASVEQTPQPFADVLRELEGQKGAQVWQNRADMKAKREEQVVRPLPQPHNQQADRAPHVQSVRLQAIQNLEAQKNATQAPKPAPANMGVNSIAAQFGGQGGYKKPPSK